MDPTCNQVYLMVSDIERSTRFYSTGLDLPVRDKGTRSVELDAGGASIKLEEDFDAETLAAFGLDEPGTDRGTGAIIVLDVESVSEMCESAASAGGEIVSEPATVEWGRKMALIQDPDGYVLEISRPL